MHDPLGIQDGSPQQGGDSYTLALKEEVQEHSRKTILEIDMIETVENSMKKANITTTKKKSVKGKA